MLAPRMAGCGDGRGALASAKRSGGAWVAPLLPSGGRRAFVAFHCRQFAGQVHLVGVAPVDPLATEIPLVGNGQQELDGTLVINAAIADRHQLGAAQRAIMDMEVPD